MATKPKDANEDIALTTSTCCTCRMWYDGVALGNDPKKEDGASIVCGNCEHAMCSDCEYGMLYRPNLLTWSRKELDNLKVVDGYTGGHRAVLLRAYPHPLTPRLYRLATHQITSTNATFSQCAQAFSGSVALAHNDATNLVYWIKCDCGIRRDGVYDSKQPMPAKCAYPACPVTINGGQEMLLNDHRGKKVKMKVGKAVAKKYVALPIGYLVMPERFEGQW